MTAPRYRTRDDMLGGLSRQIRALPAYAAESAEVDLADFDDLARQLKAAKTALVVTLVVEQGWSWARIGAELDISREAAYKQWSEAVRVARAAH